MFQEKRCEKGMHISQQIHIAKTCLDYTTTSPCPCKEHTLVCIDLSGPLKHKSYYRRNQRSAQDGCVQRLSHPSPSCVNVEDTGNLLACSVTHVPTGAALCSRWLAIHHVYIQFVDEGILGLLWNLQRYIVHLKWYESNNATNIGDPALTPAFDYRRNVTPIYEEGSPTWGMREPGIRYRQQ